MATIEKTISYDEKSFKSEGDYAKNIHPTLFFPYGKNVKGWIVEAISRKDACVQFFGTFKGHVWDVVNRIIMGEYKGCGKEINIQHLYEAVEEVAKIWEQIQYLEGIGGRNKRYNERKGKLKFVECQSEVETLIGVGVLSEDYVNGDNDCYETAGGYRSWRALKGTMVEYHLNFDLTITLKFDSNCEVDHYNNNICGVSTGNGTTKYKVGERVEKRSITLGREAIDTSWKKSKIKAEIKKIDYNKMMALVENYQPELVNAKKESKTIKK